MGHYVSVDAAAARSERSIRVFQSSSHPWRIATLTHRNRPMILAGLGEHARDVFESDMIRQSDPAPAAKGFGGQGRNGNLFDGVLVFCLRVRELHALGKAEVPPQHCPDWHHVPPFTVGSVEEDMRLDDRLLHRHGRWLRTTFFRRNGHMSECPR